MLEHPADLGQAAVAGDAGHQPLEAGGVGDPARGAGLAVAAEVDELDLEPAGARRGVEHRALQPAGEIPGRLAAHGGVEREDQPAAAGAVARRAGAGLGEEGRDPGLSLRRRPGAARRRCRSLAHRIVLAR